MNFVIDLWKSQGLKVDYAFDVAQAQKLIIENSPSVVVSDLSHYSFDQLVTDRAGFEILEWANRNAIELKVIITAANLTEERRLEAVRLGAIGICNNVDDLNNLLSKSIGVPIEIPKNIKALEEKSSQQKVNNKTISLLFDFYDYEFAKILIADLKSKGFQIITETRPNVKLGASLENKIEPTYEGEIVIIVLSRHSYKSSIIRDFIVREYKPIWGQPMRKPSKLIIPVVLDGITDEFYPRYLKDEAPVNFPGDYDMGLNELLKRI